MNAVIERLRAFQKIVETESGPHISFEIVFAPKLSWEGVDLEGAEAAAELRESKLHLQALLAGDTWAEKRQDRERWTRDLLVLMGFEGGLPDEVLEYVQFGGREVAGLAELYDGAGREAWIQGMAQLSLAHVDHKDGTVQLKLVEPGVRETEEHGILAGLASMLTASKYAVPETQTLELAWNIAYEYICLQRVVHGLGLHAAKLEFRDAPRYVATLTGKWPEP